MKNPDAVQLVWHYTSWATLPAIVGATALIPGPSAEGELPMLWFSANQQWEPSATGHFELPDGGLRRLTLDEHKRRFGCIRFGLPAADQRLLRWAEACRHARIGYTKRRKTEDWARRLGANPSDWSGTAQSIPLVGLRFQVLLDEWGEGDMSAMARLWTEKRG